MEQTAFLHDSFLLTKIKGMSLTNITQATWERATKQKRLGKAGQGLTAGWERMNWTMAASMASSSAQRAGQRSTAARPHQRAARHSRARHPEQLAGCAGSLGCTWGGLAQQRSAVQRADEAAAVVPFAMFLSASLPPLSLPRKHPSKLRMRTNVLAAGGGGGGAGRWRGGRGARPAGARGLGCRRVPILYQRNVAAETRTNREGRMCVRRVATHVPHGCRTCIHYCLRQKRRRTSLGEPSFPGAEARGNPLALQRPAC